jgi:hypothetical protein
MALTVGHVYFIENISKIISPYVIMVTNSFGEVIFQYTIGKFILSAVLIVCWDGVGRYG